MSVSGVFSYTDASVKPSHGGKVMKKTPELTREELFAKYDNQPMDKIWPLFRPYRSFLIAASSIYILFNMIGLTLPWMLKIAIDRVLPNADYLLFWILAGAMIIIYLARFLLRYVACYLIDYTGIRLIVDIRQKVFRHLQSLSLRFYEEYRTGKLISNVISDVALLNMLMRVVSQVVEQSFMLLIIAILLFMINWQMGLFVLLTIPLHYVNFRYFKRIMRDDSMMMQEKMSEISANLSETLTGVKVVKSFAKEKTESLRFFQNLRPIVDLQMKVTVDGIGLWSVYDMLTVLTYLGTIGFGIRYVQLGTITIGEFVAFYSYVGMLLGPINVLSSLSISFAQGIVGATRIVHLLNTIPDIKEAEHPIHPTKLNGFIEFSHVMFSYNKENPVIKDFSLRIHPGQKIALVGPSGSGKSTITNLLLRFYDVTSGTIKVDNVDIRKYAFEAYRGHIGVVLQEPYLFSGTIRENIAYAKNDATEEEIMHAAQQANVEEFVSTLPDGYDTVIGENGASLSGGQKQRLAIARAILKNPSILILDEATSALDTVSEYLVQEALDRLMTGKTTIIIAHRLSTVQNADSIVVLENGQIVQQGTHRELMTQRGIYAELYQTQRKMAMQMQS